MTTREDWEFRAAYLRDVAVRNEKHAAELIGQADGLRGTAKMCQEEADRIRREEHRRNPE